MLDQVTGAQVLHQVEGAHVVDQVVGVQVVVDQVAGAEVVVDQVTGVQVVVDQVAGSQVVVDLVAGTQVYGDRVAGAELLLNHFTPGDGYEFTHQVVQKGAKKWKLSFQRACLTEFQWLVYSRVKGGGYCNYCCFFFGHLTPRVLARLVKTAFVPRRTKMAC